MKIGVLGTGMVGNTIASKLLELDHEVMMGSRTNNNEKALNWVKSTNNKGSQGTFEDTAKFAELIFNCTSGKVSLEALKLAGEENLKGKILVDLANPLDFSNGMPPSLTICNTDSLGEQIQKNYPELKVVKTLNTMNCSLMVNPEVLSNADHDVFICGNDNASKETVKTFLKAFGWKSIIDLGDITQARGTEMLLPLWVRLWGTFQTPNFNFKIVKE